MTTTILDRELQRLADIRAIVLAYQEDRKKQLSKHAQYRRELESERLESVSWIEKNDLTEKLIEHQKFDPTKYLLEFKYADSPYYGIFTVQDTNTKIGNKSYVIGKQELFDRSKVVILDWRAPLAKLYYDYEQGEEYEETILGQERLGSITEKLSVVIKNSQLLSIHSPDVAYELRDGMWRQNGHEFRTSDAKALEKDHRLTDIIALISAEQFRMISKSADGCTYLTGGAGCGKTTVAIHRLSYLQYNDAEAFRQSHSLVVMFNRTLRDYVKKTSEELLGKTAIETYASWSSAALRAFRVPAFTIGTESIGDRRLGIDESEIKRRSVLSELLVSYSKSATAATALNDLWRFYASKETAQALFSDSPEKERAFVDHYETKLQTQSTLLTFADVGILLRLRQLREKLADTVIGALNYYDHIIVDEAQDFSRIELETLQAAASTRRSLTVCADEKQKILSFVDATGFKSFQLELQKGGLDREALTVSYRSPKEVMELASIVSGRPVDTSTAHRGTVELHMEDSFDDAVRSIVELHRRLSKAPGALTCVIAKQKADAAKLLRALQRIGINDLHSSLEISFDPGLQVTNAHQVKGLEFTNVIIWNPSTRDYRQSEIDRNLLYVAITRACTELHICAYQPLTSLLPSSLPRSSGV